MTATQSTARSAGDNNSERRAQLLSIAAKLIASRGYSATTVRDIADQAGILSGSLYHHFSSKEAILEEILRSFMGGLLDEFLAIEAAGSGPGQVLDSFIVHAFETIGTQHDAVGIYQNEASYLAKLPGFEFVAEISARIEQVFLTPLRQGQAEGAFRPGLDASVIYRFIRDAVWSTVRWYRPRDDNSIEQIRDDYLQFLHHGLLET